MISNIRNFHTPCPNYQTIKSNKENPSNCRGNMSQSSRPDSPDDQTAMYIRVKRNKITYFVTCVPSETILQIKEKLQDLIDQPVNDQRLILMPNREVLDDSKSLAEEKVENDAVLALTLRKDDNEFEDVNITRPTDYNPSSDGGSNW